jgi:hypothetical protein
MLLVPVVSVALVTAIVTLLEGRASSISGWVAQLLTLLLSLHIALEESLWTVFAQKTDPLKQGFNRLIKATGYVVWAAWFSWVLRLAIRYD